MMTRQKVQQATDEWILLQLGASHSFNLETENNLLFLILEDGI